MVTISFQSWFENCNYSIFYLDHYITHNVHIYRCMTLKVHFHLNRQTVSFPILWLSRWAQWAQRSQCSQLINIDEKEGGGGSTNKIKVLFNWLIIIITMVTISFQSWFENSNYSIFYLDHYIAHNVHIHLCMILREHYFVQTDWFFSNFVIIAMGTTVTTVTMLTTY